LSVKKKKESIDSNEINGAKISEAKKYIALKSTKIICNGVFELVEGKEIPLGIEAAFIQSLISSNLIK